MSDAETSEVKEKVTVPEPIAVEVAEDAQEAAVGKVKEIKETSFFLGVVIMVLIIVSGVLLYILIFGEPKTKKNIGKFIKKILGPVRWIGKFIKKIKFKSGKHKHRK